MAYIKGRTLKMSTTKQIWRYFVGALGAIVWFSLVSFLITSLHPASAFVVGTVAATIVTFMMVLPLIPNGVQYLANAPNKLARLVDSDKRAKGEYQVYDFGFFTLLSPDQAKLIERGKRFIRIVMRLDNHTFYGETLEGRRKGIQRNEQEYWDVVITPSGEIDFHPITDRGFRSWVNPFWWWCRYVYSITGAVFTGIPPFQKVRTYQMTRLEQIAEEAGSFRLIPKTDYSDHYRVADDLLFVEVKAADTRDKLPVDVQQAITIRVTNPYKIAYNTTSNWAIRATTAVEDAINTFTRQRTADEVISIKEGEDERKFSKAIVKQLNGKAAKTTGRPVLSTFGIKVSEAALLRNNLEKATQERLQDEAIAAADARARAIRGRGEAEATGHLMDAVLKRGEQGMKVFETEADVRKAEAVGKSGGTIIMGSGSRSGAVSPEVAFLQKSLEGAK